MRHSAVPHATSSMPKRQVPIRNRQVRPGLQFGFVHREKVDGDYAKDRAVREEKQYVGWLGMQRMQEESKRVVDEEKRFVIPNLESDDGAFAEGTSRREL